MEKYIEQILPEETGFAAEMRLTAEQERIPILRRDSAALLRVLTRMHRPARILEVGTAIGYSAFLMVSVLRTPPHIDTVEIAPDMVCRARRNFTQGGVSGCIRVINGDAAEVLPALQHPYDMIFLDGAKGQYLRLYEEIRRLLNPEGLLVCDNCIFYGKINTAPEAAPHKHRTIIANMREFLQRLTSDPEFQTVVLEAGDGMAVAVRTGRKEQPL